MAAHPLAPELTQLVSGLALPGGRMVGSEGHDVAADWVQTRLGELPLDPYDGQNFCLPYECDGAEFANFAGVIAGTDRSLPPVLIGAHYDSVIPHPCADDNAAAVAIALCAAAKLAHAECGRDIVLAIFDAEEPPYFQTNAMGSVRFCGDQADRRGFHAALILDLVGHDVRVPKLGMLTPPAVRDLLVIQGAESHPGLAAVAAQACDTKKLSVIAALNRYVEDMSDHYAFRAQGTPYLFLSCGQWEHYHQPSDTPEKLNYDKMGRITDLLVQLTVDAAAADLSAPVPDRDFTAKLEADSIRHALGPWLRLAGVSAMKSRADVEAFAEILKGTLA